MNILIIIPKNQFDEEELFTTRSVLQAAGARVVILSKTGKEAVGMQKTRFQPDGIIVDWNRHRGLSRKYDAVLVTGGRGSAKSLWDDDIVPQILTDHYRGGSIVGAIGASVVVLARTGFLTDANAAAPDDPEILNKLQAEGVVRVDEPVVSKNKIITARDAGAARQFAETALQILL